MKRTIILGIALLISAAPVHVTASVLVQDDFDASASTPPDATKFDWGGQVALNGVGQVYLSTDSAQHSWLQSKAGTAPGLGQTLVLQMRAYAYAENWNPGVYGDKQPRGLRVGSDANNAVEFYSLSQKSLGLRTRKDGVESLASYPLPSGVDSMHDYEISVTATSACFKVDGAVAGTLTANIPTGVLDVYVSTDDGGGGGNVPISIDSLSLSLMGGPPVITSFAPTNGLAGTVVAINGTNFTGATAVTFGGIDASYTNNSDSLITAVVPANAATGLIAVVTTNGTASSSNNFVVDVLGLTYMTNNGAIIITGYTGSCATVTIPATINGLPVSRIGDYAFQYANILASITIPDSVTNIGVQAFFSRASLTNVAMGNGVVSIGDSAFQGCAGLTNVAIPRSVTSMGSFVFSGCLSLTCISVDEMNPNYSGVGGVLYDKNQTTLLQFAPGLGGNYTIISTVGSIGNGAFYWCPGLTQATIPDSVTNIGDNAFNNCTGLTNVTFGAGITRIGNDAFDNCINLSRVALPYGLLSIGDSAFARCSVLRSFTIPDSVTSLGNFAFIYCPNLTNVIIGTNVASIGMYAFNGLNLTSVTIPRSVTSIGDSAFAHCSTLTSVYFQGNAPSLGGSSVFFYAPNVTIYHLPAASGWPPVLDLWAGRPTALWPLPYLLTVNNGIGSGSYTNGVRVSITASNPPDGQLFDRWTGATQYLDSATASSTVLTMPAQDISVTATYLPNDFTYTTNNGAITITGYTGSCASVTVPTTINGLPVTSVGSWAFRYCGSLTNVVIPDSVTSVGYAAFFGCGSLAGVTIGTNVASIDGYAFYGCGSLTGVTIPASVISIGGSPFPGCSGLRSITVDAANPAYSSLNGVLFDKSQTTLIQYPGGKIGSYTVPDSVTIIAGWAFYLCGNLPGVTLGNSVTNIGGGAFYYCTGMTNIVMPNSVTSIGGSAFFHCPSLASITIPNSVSTIGDSAFDDCSRLTSVTIPDSVTSIGHDAFLHCTALTNVTMGNALTGISDRMFYECSALTTVMIGNSVASIGSDAFASCPSLTAITVAAANSAYSSLDGVLFNKNRTTLILYPAGKAGSYSIPSGVTSIAFEAFDSSVNLTDVTIPDSVTSIGYFAFRQGASLRSVTIGRGLSSIVNAAFFLCGNLKSVYVKGDCTGISSDAFYGANQATLYYLPGATGWDSNGSGLSSALWRPQMLAGPSAGVRADGFGFTIAWAGSQVVMVEACTDLGNPVWAPVRTFALTNDVSEFTDPDWAKYPSRFYRVGGLATRPQDYTYMTNNGVISIERYTGSGGDVTVPGTLNGLPITGIGMNAFYSCAALTNVIIPDNITGIGDTAFAYCNNLTNVTIGNAATNVGYHAFFSCSGLAAITVGALNPALSSVDGILFNKDQTTLMLCPGRRAGSYAVPGSVTDIAYGAFDHCFSLTGVTIPDSVTNIESGAFYSCTSLASVDIGKSVTTIGNLAFYYCTSLTNLIVPDSVTSIAGAFSDCTGLVGVTLGNHVSDITGAFVRCTGLANVAIPDSVSSIGHMAFAGCSGLTNVTIPNSVTSIGDSAFSECRSLTSITLPNSVTIIGNYAFHFCTGLTNVAMADSVTSVGNDAFNNCTALAHVTIPNSVTSIGSTAFSGCTSLARVTIPSSVTSFGSWLFSGCTSLSDIYFKGNAPSVDSFMFNGAPLATIYYLPGTTNWDSTLAGRPTVLWNPQVQTDAASFGMRTNHFGFTITGTSNLVIVVEACTDLANPVWSAVGTNTLTSGSSYFSDPDGSNHPTRVYRLRSP